MFGRGICGKYQWRDKKNSEPIGEENFVSRLEFLANTPTQYDICLITPNII